MNKKTLISILAIIQVIIIQAQINRDACGPLTSGPAPAFVANSTKGKISFPDNYFGKWKILFSHPAAFTPVCTSEILALAANQDAFASLKTQILVISTDGLNSHIEWVASMEAMGYDGLPLSAQIQISSPLRIDFPLIADTDLEVSKKYGLLQPNNDQKRDIRGVVFIDPENNIRAFFHYPPSVGRNIEEIKRTLMALQAEDKHGVLIPVNWNPGEDVLLNSPGSKLEAEKLENKNNPKIRQVSWYLRYKKI